MFKKMLKMRQVLYNQDLGQKYPISFFRYFDQIQMLDQKHNFDQIQMFT